MLRPYINQSCRMPTATAATERGWSDTVGAWAAFFVLRGLGLGMGGGLQSWIGEEGVD